MLAKIDLFAKLLSKTKNASILLVLTLCVFHLSGCLTSVKQKKAFTKTTTFAGFSREFGEPFGIAVGKKGNVYLSDGDAGKIFRLSRTGEVVLVSDKFETPSFMVFDQNETLLIADSGAARSNDSSRDREVTLEAGTENKKVSLMESSGGFI